MAEEAQPLVVTNPGQPIVVSIKPARDYEAAQGLRVSSGGTGDIEVSINPSTSG